jgi:hypothetical protein
MVAFSQISSPPIDTYTSFTLDDMGRFLCNNLQEAAQSADQWLGGRKRDFDVIVIGGGTFGCVVAGHLFVSCFPSTSRTCRSWEVRPIRAYRG